MLYFIQSPTDEELRCLTNKEGPISPEPRYEAEIENAAKGGARFRSGFSESESGGSDQGRGPSLRDSPARITELASPDYHKSPIPNQSELQATSFRLQLGGLLAGHTKPIPGIYLFFNFCLLVTAIKAFSFFNDIFCI